MGETKLSEVSRGRIPVSLLLRAHSNPGLKFQSNHMTHIRDLLLSIEKNSLLVTKLNSYLTFESRLTNCKELSSDQDMTLTVYTRM